MSEELLREIQKMEIRLKDYLGEEEKFVKALRKCIEKFKELNNEMLKKGAVSKKELMNLRLEAITTLCETLEKGSEAEHEKSHLLKSYGALMLAMEKELKGTYAKVVFKENVRNVLNKIIQNGIAHHISVVYGDFIKPFEVFAKIKGWKIIK